MCTSGAEGAGQALWPAGTAALPSARSSGTAQAHATALVKVWECRVPISLLSCYASVKLRRELET